jgi:hypothetical protein
MMGKEGIKKQKLERMRNCAVRMFFASRRLTLQRKHCAAAVYTAAMAREFLL